MAKRKRPSYLIMVSGPKGLEIFSAHHTEADAAAMHDRLGAMLAKSAGSAVHLVRVPDAVGLVAVDKAACRRIEPKDRAVVVSIKPETVPAMTPGSIQTQEEFEEEARRLAKGNGPRDGYPDDKYVGASS